MAEGGRRWAGGLLALAGAAGTVIDIGVGMATGGTAGIEGLSALDRLERIRAHPWLGLYQLDLLNLVTTSLALGVTIEVFLLTRRHRPLAAWSALVVGAVGVAVFVAGNAALPMLELSRRLDQAGPIEQQRIAAAAEALLATGAHGSAGALPAFVLPTLSTLLLAGSTVGAPRFGRVGPWLGVAGSGALLGYLALVTFVPGALGVAMALAAPGGLLALAWSVSVGVALLGDG